MCSAKMATEICMNRWTANSSVQDCQKKEKTKKNRSSQHQRTAPSTQRYAPRPEPPRTCWYHVVCSLRKVYDGQGEGGLLRCWAIQCTAEKDCCRSFSAKGGGWDGGVGAAFDSNSTPFTYCTSTDPLPLRINKLRSEPATAPRSATPPRFKRAAEEKKTKTKTSTEQKELNALFCVFTKVHTA